MSERATAPASAPTSDMASETAPEHMPDPNAKLTTREKKWIVYDVGNSAFVMLSTAVVPIYANSLLQSAGQSNIVSTWGYAQTIASLIIAVMMPVLGSMADVQGMKVKFFTGFFLTGVVACCAMALPLSWLVFLVVCILATVGLNGSLTFYDSMLVDITSNERMDRVSSHGFAWGYIGSTIPFIACIALIFGGPSLLGWSTVACTRASFVITALWWVAFTIPLLTSYKQVHYRATAGQTGEAIRGTFAELGSTFRAIRKNKPLWMFMIAFFFYIDAVNTVISMSTSYGTSAGHRLHASGNGAAGHAVRGIPERDRLWQACRSFRRENHDHHGCGRLYLHCAVRRVLLAFRNGILDSCDSRRPVPRRHSGVVALVLWQDHSKESCQRILRFL